MVVVSPMSDYSGKRITLRSALSNALVQLQAQYHHCGEAASEKCLSAATFVRRRAPRPEVIVLGQYGVGCPKSRTTWLKLPGRAGIVDSKDPFDLFPIELTERRVDRFDGRSYREDDGLPVRPGASDHFVMQPALLSQKVIDELKELGVITAPERDERCAIAPPVFREDAVRISVLNGNPQVRMSSDVCGS